MPKIQLEAQLITCAVEVCANIGEKLIVLNDCVIGVYSENGVSTELPEITKQVVKKRTPLYANLQRDKVLSILQERPMTARGLAERLNLPVPERSDLHVLLGRLKRLGIIQPLNSSRYPVYQISLLTPAEQMQ